MHFTYKISTYIASHWHRTVKLTTYIRHSTTLTFCHFISRFLTLVCSLDASLEKSLRILWQRDFFAWQFHALYIKIASSSSSSFLYWNILRTLHLPSFASSRRGKKWENTFIFAHQIKIVEEMRREEGGKNFSFVLVPQYSLCVCAL